MPPNLAQIVDIELVILRPIVDADEVASAQFALAVVSGAVRNYCRQRLDLVLGDTVTLDGPGGPLLFLPELPVISVASVEVDGDPLTVSDDYKLAGHGVLVRQGRYRWGPGVQNVQVTYSHGYSLIPDVITGVVARAASRLFQAGLRAEETAGVLGIASKSLGDFSVSYTAEGVAEGSMGASGARVLSLSEKDLLNDYRL